MIIENECHLCQMLRHKYSCTRTATAAIEQQRSSEGGKMGETIKISGLEPTKDASRSSRRC